MAPTSTAQWTIQAKDGLDGLRLHKNVPIPQLGPFACLVKIAAVSLNYRDVAIPKGKYPMYWNDAIIPCSDGAGGIVAIGNKVSMHEVGDKVCTLFHQAFQDRRFHPALRNTTLGSNIDGPLREYAVYEETGLVAAPASLTLLEAATLPCAAVTAWNALFGLSDDKVQPADIVLTQGTGGVSLFAAQLALAAGATVIGTTSSDAKAKRLEKLGVHHVIKYKTDVNWAETAKCLSGGDGVHHVIEVGGASTLRQSLAAIRNEGVVSLVGFLGGMDQVKDQQAGLFEECFKAAAIMRSIMVGSRTQFVEMNKVIDEKGINPVIDESMFAFGEAREIYDYMLQQGFFIKILIRTSE